MHLSTHDQHVFYRRIGYQESTPVNAMRKCTVTFQEKQVTSSLFNSYNYLDIL